MLISIHDLYTGDEGKSHKPAYVMLVGTHADLSTAARQKNCKRGKSCKMRIGRNLIWENKNNLHDLAAI